MADLATRSKLELDRVVQGFEDQWGMLEIAHQRLAALLVPSENDRYFIHFRKTAENQREYKRQKIKGTK
jgi:hypothetical protein